MSLYEPSIRSNTWSLISRRGSRRFTTLEGWRELGLGVYAMGSNNIRMFSLRHQFDPEQFRDDNAAFLDDIAFLTPRDAPPVPSIQSFHTFRDPQEGTIGKAIGSVRHQKDGALRPSQWNRAHRPQQYHVFSSKEKWTLVAFVGMAGIFPSLSANIFLPALDTTAKIFDTTIGITTLSFTTYFAVLGVAPIIWGPLSETLGRRAVYLLSFLIYISASLVLSFSPHIAVLLTLRGVQAAGVASIVSVGSAVVQDISPPSERDGFFSFYQGIRNATLILAPIVGGIFANFLDFRSIFILLLGLSTAVFIVLVLFLPETLRSVAGNGSLPLTGIRQPLIWKCKVFGRPAHVGEHEESGIPPKLVSGMFTRPLSLLKEKDAILGLLFSSIVFTIWMMVTVSTTGLFRSVFSLNEILIGVAFIPNGLGAIVGSTFIGNQLNRDFAGACSNYKASHSLPPSVTISKRALPADFPLEHTRLIRLPGLAMIFVIAISFYGFTLTYPALTSRDGWIAVPLFLQFLIAAMANAICGIFQTLVADLWPEDGAAGATASNLLRWLFSAVGVGLIQLSIERIQVGPTFLALGLVVMVLVPLPIVQWYWGPDWRQERDTRDQNAAGSTSVKV